jgi:hypothetical protein
LELSAEEVEQTIPRGQPPSELIDPILERLVYESDKFRQELGESMRRSMLWSAAIQTAFERSGIWSSVPGYDFTTYGLSRDEFGELSFGAIVHIRLNELDRRRSGRRRSTRLERFILSRRRYQPFRFQIAALEVGDQSFPVHVTSGSRGPESANYSPIHPWRGTAACGVILDRAEDRKSADEQLHLLTCAHVVAEDGQGGHVALTLGQIFEQHCQGTVSRIGPPRVDAATVLPRTQGVQRSHAGASIRCVPLVPPGLNVSFQGQASGIVTTIVTDVSNPRLMGIKNYFYIEFLLFLAQSGRPGDSGALVTVQDGPTDAVGLYLGEAIGCDGDTMGRCQLMAQVKHCLQIDELVPITYIGGS